MRYGALVIAALVIGACAETAEEPVTAGSGTATLGGSVTYMYQSDVSEAAVKAASYCAKFRKRARLRSTTPVADGNLATYDCR
jgi:hypothetical protein